MVGEYGHVLSSLGLRYACYVFLVQSINLCLAYDISNHHHLLNATFGAYEFGMFQQETAAYEHRAYFLSWVMPLSVTMASLLDLVLFVVFHLKVHPWADILKKDNDDEYLTMLQESMDIILGRMSKENVKDFIADNQDNANTLLHIIQENPSFVRMINSFHLMSAIDKKEVMDDLNFKNFNYSEKQSNENLPLLQYVAAVKTLPELKKAENIWLVGKKESKEKNMDDTYDASTV